MSIWRKIATWLGGRKPLPSGFHKVKGPRGEVMIVDQLTFDYLKSTAPAPTQESLDKIIKLLRRIRVYNGGVFGSDLGTNDLLFETERDEDLKALGESLRIKDRSAGHCMCLGDPTIELLGEGAERLALITLHHGRTIRWNRWKDDAELLDGPGLLGWLADRGVTYPLRDYEENCRRAEHGERAWHRWLDHMPSCLSPFAQEMRRDFGWNIFIAAPDFTESGATAHDIPKEREGRTVPIEKLRNALGETYPDGADRALALLDWFGNGLGPWTGFPAYEEIADLLLLRVSEDDLKRALSQLGLSEAQLEGGARFLSGPDSQSIRAGVWARLPDGAKKMFCEHVQLYTDEDRKKRAQRLLPTEKQKAGPI